MEVKIAVVVPTYRRPGLLMRCLTALLQQDFSKAEYEIIVVSDGEDPETAEAMQAYQGCAAPAVQYLQTPVKKGPAASRNAGWKATRAKLVAFTDDDCIPQADWLRQAYEAYTGEEVIAFTGRVVVPRKEIPTDYELNVAGLETAEFVTANCVCTRKALEITGGFDERFAMAWREDSDLHFKLLEAGIPIHKIQATVWHPVRPAPWGVSIKEQKKTAYNALLYRKFPVLYRQRIKAAPSWNYYGMVFFFAAGLLCLWQQLYLYSSVLLACWLSLLILFIAKRLRGTSKEAAHVTEMVVTSAVIPFVSLYWQWYGAAKFRVLLF